MTSTPENKLTASAGAIETSKPALGILPLISLGGEPRTVVSQECLHKFQFAEKALEIETLKVRVAELEELVSQAESRANAKNVRIAELEKQLAERDNQLTLARGDVEVYRKQLATRSPGVMPECVKRLADLSRNNEVTMGELEAAVESVEAHFSPRDGHEWKTVDDANHITAEDVGREVCCLGRIIGSRGSVESCVKISQTHILRPIAPKFVFAGELGWYEFTSTFGTGRMEVVRRSDGSLAGLHEVGRVDISPDGTFAGGRITRRAE